MESITLTMVLQTVVAVGLLNVWLVRARSATAFRGGDARSLKDEFAAYGLPPAAFYVVGALKLAAAVALLAGLWVEPVVRPAAAVVAVLMLGALAMHAKVGDPPRRFVPAGLMLVMNVLIVVL